MMVSGTLLGGGGDTPCRGGVGPRGIVAWPTLGDKRLAVTSVRLRKEVDDADATIPARRLKNATAFTMLHSDSLSAERAL